MALGPFYDYVHKEKAQIPVRIKATFEAMFTNIE